MERLQSQSVTILYEMLCPAPPPPSPLQVRNLLNEYPFPFKHDDVKILDGADEGSFAWVSL